MYSRDIYKIYMCFSLCVREDAWKGLLLVTGKAETMT